MKIIIKLLSFLIILNFISCYDDKGNYDYEKINDITIESGRHLKYIRNSNMPLMTVRI